MEFYKFKSKYQRSLRSMFSLTKEWTLVNKKKQILSSVNNLMKYLEYFLFNCKFFCFYLKKNYLFPVGEQLITLKGFSDNFFTKNYREASIFLFFKKLKNSRSTILLFFNIPFIISLLISEIFESIIKKTIYLYRFFLLLSIPVIIFCVNKNFVLQNKKDYFSFILPENQKIFLSCSDDGHAGGDYQNGKNYFYLKNLRKISFQDYIFNFLSKKIKSFNLQKPEGEQNYSGGQAYLFEEKRSYLSSFAPNFYEAFGPFRILSKARSAVERSAKYKKKKFSFLNPGGEQFPSNNIQTTDGKTKYIDQQSIIIAKWFSTYIKLKQNYSIQFQNHYSTKENKLKNIYQGPEALRKIANANSDLKSLESFPGGDQFLQKIDSFFFSLIKPRDFNDLRNFAPLKLLDKKNSVLFPGGEDILELQNKRLNQKSFYREDNIHWYTQKINKNARLPVNLAPRINKQQWRAVGIQQWMKCFAPSQDKFHCLLKNKQKLKENFQFFQNFQFIIQSLKRLASALWTPLGQIYFEKSLFNRARNPQSGQSVFINNQHPFVFRSYKNSLNFERCEPVPGPKVVFPPAPLAEAKFILKNRRRSLLEMASKNYYLESFAPLYIKKTNNKSPEVPLGGGEQIYQKINFLYNFSCLGVDHFTNDYLFINPETLFLIQNACLQAEKNPLKNLKPSQHFTAPPLSLWGTSGEGALGTKQNCQSFLMGQELAHNLYDLDFYLNNRYAPNEDFFSYAPSSSVSLLDLKGTSATIFKQPVGEDFKLIKKKREKLQNILHSTKFKFFKKYNKWIFTPQWWLFRKQGILTEIQSLIENFTNNTKVLLYQLSTKLAPLRAFGSSEGNYANKKYLLCRNGPRLPETLNKIQNIFVFQVQSWNKLLVERIYTSQQEQSLWINLKLLLSVNNSSWSFFAWFFTSSIVYYHWFPMFSGVLYLYLWLDFEKIRSLSNPSWKTFLSILTHNSFDSPSQQLRLAGYLSRGRMFSIYSKFYRIYNEIFFLLNRLNYITTLDLSRRNKNLVSNSFITKKTLQSKYYFWNINKPPEVPLGGGEQNTDGFVGSKHGSLNGFSFFQKWYEKNCRISSFFQNTVTKSFSLNWLNDLFFYNKLLLPASRALAKEGQLLGGTKLSNSNRISISYLPHGKSKPTPLLEPLTYTQRWLFIGSLESGKSFVIKNLAASCSAPLIHISIKDIKNATPDSKYTKIRKQKRWIEQLSERSFFLENIFNLAKIVAPSIFWISDLHDFETKNQLQEKNTQKFDISLLMATLLKILSIDLVPEKQNQITFIGSTEYPRLLDPKFVSRQRLDLIVNFRTPSFSQRQSIFSFLLKTKGFTIKGANRSFYELNSNTLGYTFRDITSLVNETLLIKTTEKTTSIDSNTIRLALYRQTSTQSVKYKIIRQENLHYKIGKALVQAILVYPKSIMLLSKYHDLWKTKFYYLSNTYLEVSSKKAITTEFVLLTQILNCLAGSAARDAWILSTRGPFTEYKEPAALALTSQLKHDFSIASNILQSLLVEFSMQDITCLNPKKKKNRKDISKTFHFNFIKRATSYLESFDQFPSYINWSIKVKRLSFNWILFFSGIEHSTKNLARLLFLDKSKKNIFSPILEKSIDINIPYERRETKRQQQKLQKIDSLFNKMTYTMYMENLGFPWESEYVMDYNPFQFSLFFREARPLWNPQTIMPSYSILFFDRDLLINQKLLTKLYITYGNKFQIEKLNRKRIKKQFFWSNFAFNKVDLNKISEIKKPGGEDFGNYQILPHGIPWADFHFYQNLISLNAQLDQSQIQLPVYLHQGWITADPNESFRTFDILSTKILVNNAHLIYKESFLFEILLEIYHYLLKFFIKNKNIMIHINEILMKNEILYRQDIEIMMKKYYQKSSFGTYGKRTY